jgi:hypothetical protein
MIISIFDNHLTKYYKDELMKILIYILLSLLFIVIGCGNNDSNTQESDQNINNLQSNTRSGEVIDKIDSGNYSYLQLKENGKIYWIAVPTMKIDNGEKLYFSQYMEMQDFRSESLDRTFESLLFVSDANKIADRKTLESAHSNLKSVIEDGISIEPLNGGNTIEQIFDEKETLKNKIVKVRGKVVKFNGGIMNRNWIHIQDGTDNEGDYDLLITSKEVVKVGDIVVAEGQLAIDKDFGAGYFYSVVLENAIITTE